jgi:membrane protein
VTSRRMPRDRPLWPVDAVLGLARDWIGRFLAVQGIDRAMAISAYAYTALIPLLIVYSSLLPRSGNATFADSLIARFSLTGSAAESVRTAFAPTGSVQSGVTALGVVLLLVSALSFTRGMQRLYELAFGLPTRGMRNTAWGLLWIFIVCSATWIRPFVLGSLDGVLEIIGSFVIGDALWLVTPYLLLGRRVPWLKLVPVALLSTIGMTAVGIWSVIWLPHTISSSASQYGVIGIGFALVTWLFTASCVLVAAATGGAMVTDRLSARRVESPR